VNNLEFPQTLAAIKMEKNFIAVNQKGKTRYPYKDMTLKQLQKRLHDEVKELDESIEKKDTKNGRLECGDVSNITDYIFEALQNTPQEKTPDNMIYVTVTCKRYLTDFCWNKCAHRGFGCAGEHVNPTKT
jgi:hypothetical protein